MTLVVVSTLACLVLAALVLAYTAFPHRNAPTPGAPWLDHALGRVRDAVPVVHDGEMEADDSEDRSDPIPELASRRSS